MPGAIAPYNFVPFPARIIPAEPEALRPVADRYEATRHTGWLEIRLTALTPLYTRGVLGVSPNFPAPIATVGGGDGRQAADFFHRGETADPRLCRPVLPGSSLRGMFGSVFEIMAQSRPRFVARHRLFYRYFAAAQDELREFYARSFQPDARLVAGVLRRRHTTQGREWRLEVSDFAPPGQTPRGFVAVHVSRLPPHLRRRRSGGNIYALLSQPVTLTGREVALLTSPSQLTVPEAEPAGAGHPGLLQSHLVLPGPDLPRPWPDGHQPSRTWFQAILTPDLAHESREYAVPQAVYDDYLDWGQMAHGARFPANNQTAPRKLEDGSPVFALLSTDNPAEVSVIGANMMLSLRHAASLQDVAERSYAVAASDAEADMAQALFGRVPTADEAAAGVRAIRGRVFMEDATCLSDTWYLEDADPVRVPSILLGPKPTAIQMYLEQPGGHLVHWSDPAARLQGFKRYWHRPESEALTELTIDSGAPLDPVRTRICPVKAQTGFAGRVRFENLTDRELGALYACIQLPWESKSGCRLAHKFGMGKSLGLGSLRVEVTRVVLLDMRQRYSTFRHPTECEIAGQCPQVETLRRLTEAYSEFVNAVGKGGTLWRRRSMRALANLLSWQPQPPATVTRHIRVQNDPDAPRQWKDRVALASPLLALPDRPIPDVLLVSRPDMAPGLAPPPPTLPEPSPAKPARRSFIRGEIIEVTVVRRFGSKQGDVRIDDGTEAGRVVRNAHIGDCPAGDTTTMVVTAVNEEGIVTGLRRV